MEGKGEMSLQVWLPLTKDLRNQGLSECTVTAQGSATFISNGKLGGCYQLGTSTGYLELEKTPFVNNSGSFSVSIWVKVITWNNNYSNVFIMHAGSYSYAAGICGLCRHSSTNKLSFQVADGTNSNYATQTGDITLNQWYHFCCTYDGTKVYLYQDGVLVGSNVISFTPDFSKIQGVLVGIQQGNHYQCNNCINDFRFYDHCLSPMEVKQLSKGLVLHYPLNRNGWGQENLLTSSYRDITTWDRTAQGTWNITHNNESNTVILVSTGSWEHLYKLLPITFEVGTQYTLSCRYKVLQNYNRWNSSYSVGLSLNANNPGTNAQNATNIIIPFGSVATDYITDKITFTATTSTYYLDVNGGYIADGSQNIGFEIANIKLEKGPVMTPWCPNSSDALATIIGLNDTIEYDYSGFCNNGTRTGTFTWTSDTPKYSVSQYFNGSSYAKTDAGTFSWFEFDKCTVAIWMKPTTSPSSWAGTFGIAHDNSSTNKSFVIGNYGGKFTVQSANGSWVNIQSSDLPINEWHHCVATLDGTTVKMYIDGGLVKTETISWGTTTVASDTRVQVGVDLPGSDEVYVGYYSDARIYATALSASDVLSLYQNCATIDADGTIHGQIRS